MGQHYELRNYEDVEVIKEHKLILVRHKETKVLAVKRYVRNELTQAYKTLQLVHSNHIPEVYDVVNDGDKTIVIHEYVQGISLGEKIASNKQLSDSEILHISLQLCDALKAIHSLNAKIIHRDIKPENVIIGDNGMVKLIDFDAARIYQKGASKDTEYIGTQGYAAPEQYGFGQTDERSDIYALGILLEKLCGDRETKLSKVIKRSTSFDPAKRYKKVGRLKSAIVLSKYLTKQNFIRITASVAACAIVLFVAIGAKSYIHQQKYNESVKQYAGHKNYYRKRLAAGLSNTGVILPNGKVEAVGANEMGRSDVHGWEDVVAIDMHYFNTVGLKSDGTVYTTGDTYFGQDMAREWTGIVDVAAGGSFIMGLRGDGTVVTVGSNQSGQRDVEHWTDIVEIDANFDFAAYGLRKDGTVVVAGEFAEKQELESWTNIVSITATGDGLIGLKSDGTVVAAHDTDLCFGTCKINSWDNVIQIASGGSNIYGLKKDGTVVAAGVNEFGNNDVQDWHNIVSVAGGVGHVVGLKSDGTLVTAGANMYGESNVDKWNIKLKFDK